MLPPKVLLVDDEQGPRFGILRFLRSHGFEVVEAEDCASARERFRASRPEICILDYRLPDGTALDLLPEMCETSAVIVLTAYASIETAVEAVKLGADQFFTKPVELEALLVVIRRLLDNQRKSRQLRADTQSGALRLTADPFAGTSAAIRELYHRAKEVLKTDSTVLIQGETGTGKSMLARWIHGQSRRAGEAFVDLNCAGISREFLESELFGHEKGAFTGAVAAKPGLLETAHRGSVFLDEIGDMDLRVQASILKVLEEKRFRRMGEVRDRTVDVRLIAATHRDLREAVTAGAFRQDLYYRISTLELRVPPLRERRGDIPLLAAGMLEMLARDLGQPRASLSSDAAQRLTEYDWPGNIRELRNVLERALLRHGGGFLGAEVFDLPEAGRRAAGSAPASAGIEVAGRTDDTTAATAPAGSSQRTLDEVERDHIVQVLAEEGGSVERAAERLGVSRSAVYYKARKYAIPLSRIRN